MTDTQRSFERNLIVGMYFILGILCCLSGLMLTVSALDGAHIIPNFILRSEFEYSAQKAVGFLLIGEAFLAFGLWLLMIEFPRLRRKT